MNTSFATTADTRAKQELINQIAELERQIASYREAERRRMNALFEERLEARRAEEATAEKAVEDERQKLERDGLPRPTSIAAYRALSLPLRAALCGAWGHELPNQIAARERAGITWEEFDALRAAEQRFNRDED